MLFFVHNYGGNEFHMAALAALLDPEGRFAIACPRGGHDVAAAVGGASFYRIDAATFTYDEPSFAAALTSLDETLDRACAEGGFDRSRSVLGGFSQGAGLALALAYGTRTSGRDGSAPPRPAAVVALSPPIHPPARVAWDLAGAGPAVDAFVGHGLEDGTFPAEASRRFVEELQRSGADACWRGYPVRHLVTLEALVDARAWLATR